MGVPLRLWGQAPSENQSASERSHETTLPRVKPHGTVKENWARMRLDSGTASCALSGWRPQKRLQRATCAVSQPCLAQEARPASPAGLRLSHEGAAHLSSQHGVRTGSKALSAQLPRGAQEPRSDLSVGPGWGASQPAGLISGREASSRSSLARDENRAPLASGTWSTRPGALLRDVAPPPLRGVRTDRSASPGPSSRGSPPPCSASCGRSCARCASWWWPFPRGASFSPRL